MTTTGDRIYPFTGIVGMADLKLALLLNAVSPAIGGVLVRGEKAVVPAVSTRSMSSEPVSRSSVAPTGSSASVT